MIPPAGGRKDAPRSSLLAGQLHLAGRGGQRGQPGRDAGPHPGGRRPPPQCDQTGANRSATKHLTGAAIIAAGWPEQS